LMSRSNDLLDRIFEYVDQHQDEIVDFLSRLIELKPLNQGTRGSGQELRAQDWMHNRLRELGFGNVDYWAVDSEGKRPNVVATIKGVGGGRSLIFNGHIDVVPVHDYQRHRWTVDPWKATLKNGMVYGRGASDMLGGLTAMVWAAKAILDRGPKLKGDLYLESVPGEESGEGDIGTTACIKRGYTAPFAIVGEPTSGEIQPVTCGTFMFDITVPGKDIHTSMKNLTLHPQRYGLPHGSDVGVDAIAKAMKYVATFQELERNWGFRWRHPVLGSGGQPIPTDKEGIGAFTITPALIEGGTYFGALAGYCKMTCQVYYPPWVVARDVWKDIKDAIGAVSTTDDWLKANPPILKVDRTLEGNDDYFMWEPNEVSMNHPGCNALADAWKQSTGKEAVFSGFKAVCDATLFGKAGIPAVIFGPGDLSTGVHGPDERISTKGMLDCCKAYVAMAVNWCGTS
jgi:acetylornithine deacetylase/succinyl-diaminopimelate desuccinylase family protein